MEREISLLPARVLKMPAKPVRSFDSTVAGVVADLLDTMRGSSHSVGVAAPQIGVGLRIFCVDVTGHPKAQSEHGEFVLINPVVVRARGREVGREGCMSVPDLTGDVVRAAELVITGLTPAGAETVMEVDAFEARAVAHEIDHLDGFVFLDRVVAGDRVFRRRRYR